ncbi:uncharacterized protein FOMMEDRAFT_160211 [Fomitiporia mediterranea MF3/22]|uniref:uncharacterized protein n=1 Tax=Fomitiporia mediterranea (strain MF3/22) TaxID=694068 RepID=UPI0004407660|nr:uncharacterized protein FOMMEDRAFT_160211 [Fomitiporia mediterranea MF3/22]EJC99770.1 hypothetical protein FOMMEDRAFT_160211 [Fomitiporia mediterranea MF3/22]
MHGKIDVAYHDNRLTFREATVWYGSPIYLSLSLVLPPNLEHSRRLEHISPHADFPQCPSNMYQLEYKGESFDRVERDPPGTASTSIRERQTSWSRIRMYRITRTIEVDDGTERLKSCIPDFGIIRQVGRRTIEINGEEVELQPYSRLVAIGEIKCSPVDPSRQSVYNALREARSDLVKQIRIFFKAHPTFKTVIGIMAAGDWWTFQKFFREDFVNIPDSDSEDDREFEPAASLPSTDSSTAGVSDRDELDIISRDGNRGADDDDNNDDNVFERPIFKLQTLESNFAIAVLIDMIRKLEGCEMFGGVPL